MNAIIEKYLSKFEAMVDLEHQQRSREICRKVLEFEQVEALPFVLSDESGAPDTDWPTFPYNDTFVDPAKMLLDQLRKPFIHNQLRDFHPLNIRCNYGTVILPNIFGAGFQLTENSMPWAHHIGDRDEIRKLVDQGIPDCKSGLGGKCFETAQYYKQVLSGYPKLEEAISIYHPDLQGPFDVAHLIWGPNIFLASYDCPDLVHELLSLITDTYALWMRAWKEFTGEGNRFTTHWSFYIKGGIIPRNDTAVILSSEHYDEFVKPYDQTLLDEFGGCIHFCGKGDQFVESMCKSRNLSGIHASQPELNDVELLVKSALSNRIALLGLPEKYVSSELRTGVIVLR